MGQKVDLMPRRIKRDKWSFNPSAGWIIIRKSLPFWQSHMRGYVHRVRDGVVICTDGVPVHAAFGLWCGMTGLNKNGTLLYEPGPRDVLCATCEGRAIRAGLLGAPIIAGRPVRFSPRV